MRAPSGHTCSYLMGIGAWLLSEFFEQDFFHGVTVGHQRLKTPAHSALAFCIESGVIESQLIGIARTASMLGTMVGIGLTKSLRPEISASRWARIFCPSCDRTKSSHSLAEAGCGQPCTMNITCGSSTTPSLGSKNC